MKILFIGGTGNISSCVSKKVLECGYDLTLLNRGKRCRAFPGAQTIHADISNINELRVLLSAVQWDVVVDWIAFHESDILRDYDLFKGKTKQYIFISSASVYQKPLASPYITESTPLCNPYWKYSQEKIACEILLQRLYREENFPITIVRPSHTYNTIIPVVLGSGTEYNVVQRMKEGKKVIIHGDGTTLWTVTHARDFAKGFVGLLGHQQAIGEAFHITSDEVLTWNQIYEAIGDALGCKPRYIHIPSKLLIHFDPTLAGPLLGDKSTSVIFDNTKIKRFVPGYVATTPFRKGIRETLAWFKEDPSRQYINRELNEWMDNVIALYERLFL
ncbi:MAG: SDR family oxidoreductase [Bacteroidetes bacterium]|nr:SDR family oxidoreductase [Bacteroidota bacterium]